MDQNTINEGKTLGLVAYLTLFGTLIAFFMNQEKRNPFTSFHVRQGLGLGLIYILIAMVISSLDSMMISMSFWIFFSILYFYGLFGAITGKCNKIPILGDLFQNKFKSLGK
ncbi:hypothetical protein HSX10_15665 [Winogradskyella undariae]|uniref:hypothetical protein n=1 Tax=Winogradskyella TaxID=286104 RepID=UPI00156B4194|nr:MULTISPECIES: hypothetical protein [Winogradskyella]NRR93013.1 hypothetical protein [Winogradskyella undariae]QXP79278.1 hypothetical protein H0I32_01090 [Winogradskyella sp. HaHa_3_26]